MAHTNHPQAARRPHGGVLVRQADAHFACQRRGAFTLVEMLVVVTIIAILASITTKAVNSAKEKARQTDCMSNLRQLGTALVTYRADNRGRNPGWLSNLYPTYVDDKRIYVCRSDKARGRGDCRPDDVPRLTSGYDESVLNDYGDSEEYGKNPDIDANSYMYEFSAAPCPWTLNGASATWNEFKENQLAKGDANSDNRPYSSSRMPIVRCYHHRHYGRVRGRANAGASAATPQPITLNVAYAGNVIISPLWWEGALEPGEE